MWIHPNLYQLHLWFTYSFKVILHLILYCIHIDLKHIILFKENKKLFKAIKTPTKFLTTKYWNIVILFTQQGGLKKLVQVVTIFFLFHLLLDFPTTNLWPLTIIKETTSPPSPPPPPLPPSSTSSSNVNCCFITIYNSTWRSSKAS